MMAGSDILGGWAHRFGLAESPLFGPTENCLAGEHRVLLDGGYGSFALSVHPERPWADHRTPADWSWSSNLPHHVTVTDREVAVVRWDKPGEEAFTLESVERELEAFYQYLSADRVKSNQRVVEHMLSVFRSVRSTLYDSGIEDEFSVDAYLALLSRAIDRQTSVGQPTSDDTAKGEEVLQSLAEGQVEGLLEVLTSPGYAGLTTHPLLAVRHAGSDIFQEAHFELTRAHSADMFGYARPAESARVTRGGAHFTPPALARSVVEQTLRHLPRLKDRKELTLLDPACGSGAFLHEALRTLRRMDYKGRVRLVGRDTSRAAVAMARFALRNALSDWPPPGGHEVDVEQADSLAARLPGADAVLMNPPFISWLALTDGQRERMADVLGPLYRGRADYSMAFVTKALNVLNEGGVVGTLLPSSLLVLEAALKWRKDLSERATTHFMASLGDYGLFPYAQVQVAIAVLSKSTTAHAPSDSIAVLVTENDRQATGEALRALRKAVPGRSAILEEKGWRMFQTTRRSLQSRPTWKLVPPATQQALDRLLDAGHMLKAGDLFHIRQGVLTGLNSAFLLDRSGLEALPKPERQWFRPAVTNETLRMGRILPDRFVFYPYREAGLAITSEEQLVERLPEYFATVLEPNKDRLARRDSLGDRHDWWGLTRHRAWARAPAPGIASKYRGAFGAFAANTDGRFVVVQGYAWLPAWKSAGKTSEDPEWESITDLLAAYAAILNSSPFQRLLGIHAPQVSGGQFDLSSRYVSQVPVPNIPALSADSPAGRTVQSLIELGLSDDRGSNWADSADRLTLDLYGEEVVKFL